MTGLWVLVGTLVAAVVAGVTLRVRDGRFRSVPSVAPRPRPGTGAVPKTGAVPNVDVAPASDVVPNVGVVVAPDARPGSLAAELSRLGVARGDRATLLQFSTSFCAPCRKTRQVLAEAARIVPGVVHAEVDAESHLELVRRLGVRRTPTVLVLDHDAVEVRRASGAPPTRASVIAAIDHAVNSSRGLSYDRSRDGAVPAQWPEHDSSDSSGDR